MKRVFVFLFLFLLSKNHCFGQDYLTRYSQGITPMHKFFQQYADSTIIIEYANVPDGKPSGYKLISKTGNFVNTFNYVPVDTAYYPLYKLKKSFPVILWNMIGVERSNFKNRPADINIFFNIVPLSSDTTKKIWQDISKFKPWQLVDDKSHPSCPPDKNYAVATDGLYSIMHLITKKEVKTLIFYDPKYYEEQCPGDKNRQGIIGIERLFYKYIPLKSIFE